MVASAYLLLIALGQGPTDQLQKLATRSALELTWSDAEDRLQGSVTPVDPRAGQPVQVSVHVGTYQGKPFEGPVTLTLRKASEQHGEEYTVSRGAVNWNATFHPADDGPYILDLAFRTTRLKVTHVPIEVGSAKLARWPWWALVGLAALSALALGVRALTGKSAPSA